MSDPVKEIERLLRESHAELVRSRKHLVYKLDNGFTFVMAKTPGAYRGPDKELARLKRLRSGQIFQKGPRSHDIPEEEAVTQILKELWRVGRFLPQELLDGMRKIVFMSQELLIQLPIPNIQRWVDEVNIEWKLDEFVVRATLSEDGISYRSGMLDPEGFTDVHFKEALSERLVWLLDKISSEQEEKR